MLSDFFFPAIPFPIFATGYHITENEMGNNNMQRILFEKANLIQKTIPKRNRFEFRGELLFSSNLSFLSDVYSPPLLQFHKL